MTSTEGLRISNNTFDRVMGSKPNDTGGFYGIDGGSLIWLASCRSVTASGNRVLHAGAHLGQRVSGVDVAEDVLKSVRRSIPDEGP